MDIEDWRLNLVSHITEDTILKWNNQKLKKGTVIKTVSVVQLNKKKLLTVPVPNATSMCLKVSYERFTQADSIRQTSGIRKSIKKNQTFKSDKDAIDYAEFMFESVIMAYTAIEAFANEHIPDDFETWEPKKNAIIAERKTKSDIERFDSTSNKLSIILPQVFDSQSPKGTKYWQDFVALKRIRDRIIHMKTEDRRSSGHEVDTLWNQIYKIEAPYRQAMSIIKFFVKNMDVAPRWYQMCEFKDL
ncbi:hypothetical protein BCT47_02930 [Vibrio splendidus]|uniref:hypothetical protein n=1 Tax=Vibrio splendidus TaxID=29497 RepID=UPI000C86510D|nr:hypothetical protein [Vibrio splendidus]PMM74504.1 hypothetical protein BCT47_02930 [Vibrio splendidus]